MGTNRGLKAFAILVIGSMGLVPLACIRPSPVGPTPSSTPTATPTPQCGFISLPNLSDSVLNYGQFVIQNQAEWTNLNDAVPAPVNFSSQMILEITRPETGGCIISTWPSFVSVCVYFDHIAVVYLNGSGLVPGTTPIPYNASTPVVVTPIGTVVPPIITPGPDCNEVTEILGQVMVAIPRSNLPVTWISQ